MDAHGHLSTDEKRAIAQAVARAEAGTTGEIVCMFAQEVSEYREVPVAWAAAAALFAPLLAVLAGWRPGLPSGLPGWLGGGSGWEAAGPGAAAAADLRGPLAAYALVQAAAFLLVFLLVSVPVVRRAFTPGSLKAHRVKKAAMLQYVATGMAQAADRTGVVVFASLLDRKVELVADEMIHKAVGDTVWSEAVRAVQEGMGRGAAAEGFVRAVELCGAALAEHFPSRGPRANAFSDEVVEL